MAGPSAVHVAEDRLAFTPERAYWLNPKTGSLACVELSGNGIYTPPQGEGLQDFVLILAAKDAAERFEKA